jgi:DNA-binding transcriptional ArsR family regulator
MAHDDDARPEETDALLRAVDDLERRVAALEHAAQPTRREAAAPDTAPAGTAQPRGAAADTFWALDGLRARRAEHPSTESGTVMLTGSVTLPDGTPVEWQQGAGSAGLLEVDWTDRAATLAALGHPVRVELLRHVLSGSRTTADLAAIDSLGTTGQLHHHLRQLLTAGWLRQSGRGTYEVPPSRVVPLLVCLVAVER